MHKVGSWPFGRPVAARVVVDDRHLTARLPFSGPLLSAGLYQVPVVVVVVVIVVLRLDAKVAEAFLGRVARRYRLVPHAASCQLAQRPRQRARQRQWHPTRGAHHGPGQQAVRWSAIRSWVASGPAWRSASPPTCTVVVVLGRRRATVASIVERLQVLLALPLALQLSLRLASLSRAAGNSQCADHSESEQRD